VLFLPVGIARHRSDWFGWIAAPMLLVVAARLIWCGSPLTVAVGFGAVLILSMSLAGERPHIPEALLFASQSVLTGCRGLAAYIRRLQRVLPITGWIAVALPCAALALFSLLFALANPNLFSWLRESLSHWIMRLPKWLVDFAPRPTEVVFCVASAWITAGLLRPFVTRYLPTSPSIPPQSIETNVPPAERAQLFNAFQNTLIVVIVLFAVYLAFEFKTLWFRVFEPGFYYSGYAHEGAAWLTIALALATVILSAIFRGRTLHDPRLSRLRRFAWVWSLENVLLAIAVYHRLFIYIGFNGMTRMRTVGLFGISTVVAGFFMVLWKIARNRDFIWLMRRHLCTLAIATTLYSITPVDFLVMRYNVERIMGGDPAPCVQISVHPISSEGYLTLHPLVNCNDAMIREGIKALLAQRLKLAEEYSARRQRDGWTAYQVSDEVLLGQLRTSQSEWSEYSDGRKRDAQLKEFHRYAYQWY
jgi:Domain of unknown function (DUF4153)